MSLSAYDDLVHELTRLDADDAASTARAAKQLERRRTALRAVENDLVERSARLAELSSRLRYTAPNLTPAPDDLADSLAAYGMAEDGDGIEAIESAEPAPPMPPAENEIDRELTRAQRALREADAALAKTTRTAQRPTLLPGAHHVVREILVYGACMIACFAGQMLYLAATNGGGEAAWWVTFLPPVMAALVGYLLVGTANRPRLPMLDRNGRPLKPVVPHNPRLGVTLAVCTMALFAYFAFFA
ncbi:hypothetical protein [Glycomyces harbinensis]|uniref:Uncharacterized protein n=1 Tax=Glycomyces harbinensis TaxID=58114 RepID=A0A1G6TM84_9ACTN|nr:hypothetical protein [Glycomyces harbinensis]SDD29964.1 hypothetical protein SAMN05216270_10342 [Glycomyces harbinensis]